MTKIFLSLKFQWQKYFCHSNLSGRNILRLDSIFSEHFFFFVFCLQKWSKNLKFLSGSRNFCTACSDPCSRSTIPFIFAQWVDDVPNPLSAEFQVPTVFWICCGALQSWWANQDQTSFGKIKPLKFNYKLHWFLVVKIALVFSYKNFINF